jgi:hypothetical protein
MRLATAAASAATPFLRRIEIPAFTHRPLRAMVCGLQSNLMAAN